MPRNISFPPLRTNSRSCGCAVDCLEKCKHRFNFGYPAVLSSLFARCKKKKKEKEKYVIYNVTCKVANFISTSRGRALRRILRHYYLIRYKFHKYTARDIKCCLAKILSIHYPLLHLLHFLENCTGIVRRSYIAFYCAVSTRSVNPFTR